MKRPIRAVLVALPMLGLLWTVLDHIRVRGEKRNLLAFGERRPATIAPGISRRIESENDPGIAALVLARATVSEYLDPERRLAAAAGATQESTLEALYGARDLSRATLATRPTNWQAAMLLGATTYLIRLQERDTRLFSHARDWEGPLEAAHQLAPGQIEPRRFLAAAYLDTWAALSPLKRDVTRTILDEILHERKSFRLLIDGWLRVSADAGPERTEPFQLIPEEAWAWSYLLDRLASSREWERYAVARGRWHRALARSLRSSNEEATERLEGGDVDGARTLLTSVVAQTPLGLDYAPLFAAALSRLPPGPVARSAERRLRQWHDWTLRLCATVGCPLAPAVLGRLSGGVRDALPHEAAIAALAAGNRPAAEAIERRNRVVLEESWVDYLLYKTARMLDANDLPAALAALASVHNSAAETPRYGELTARISALTGEGTGSTLSSERESWATSAWRERRDGFTLELLPSREARGLALMLPSVAGGGAVDVLWDGERLGTFVAGGREAIEIEIDVTPELHLLEVAPITGARPRAAPVRLLGPRASSS